MQQLLSHQFDPVIIREYDIRGIVDQNLTEKDAYFIGITFATILINNNNVGNNNSNSNYKIAVGLDGRLTSPKLSLALTNGLTDAGISVVNIGICPTPMLYYTVYEQKLDGGIMVTGSHNPPNYNGFKMMMGLNSFFGDDIRNLATLSNSGKLKIAEDKGKIENIDITPKYINRLKEELNPIIQEIADKNLKVVWDPGNGATGEVVQTLCKDLPNNNIVINGDIDGNFPAHHPDPTLKENLTQIIDIIKTDKCDLGIAFDGDGDRVVFLDSHGIPLVGDHMLLIFSRNFFEDPKNAGQTVIADVKSSDIIFNEIEKLGGNPLIWKTGHSLIKTKMKQENVRIAGEMSGHIFFADRYYGFDDGIYAALRMLRMLSTSHKTLSDHREMIPISYSTEEMRIECVEEQKFAIVNKLSNILKSQHKTFSNIDGIRVRDDMGWWLIRASNTQAALVVRVESTSTSGLATLISELESYLEMVGINNAFANQNAHAI